MAQIRRCPWHSPKKSRTRGARGAGLKTSRNSTPRSSARKSELLLTVPETERTTRAFHAAVQTDGQSKERIDLGADGVDAKAVQEEAVLKDGGSFDDGLIA